MLDPPGTKAAQVFVKGNGFIAAGYLHRSSRNGDPQLHTHVLIANATKGPDGKWTRLYHPAIYDHAKTAGYIYEAHLRHELTRRLGVEWQPVRNGIAEIKGFKPTSGLRPSRPAARKYSRRPVPMPRPAPDRWRRSPPATRRRRGLRPRDLRQRWRSKAEEIGLDRDAISATMGKEVELAARLTLKRSTAR